MSERNAIWVRGAREHNLRGIDVCIPRDRLVVITGLSGSGKSSLAFDTIFAEGQRRYVESLSAYARQFLAQLAKPDVDSIDGLSPAISIEQKSVVKNPRSTVGTITEILDHLRLLFARVGQPHCTSCQKPIQRQSVEQMTDRVLSLPEGTRAMIFGPAVRKRKGEWRSLLDDFRRKGFVRVRVDGILFDLAEEIVVDKRGRHDIDVVVDRLLVKPEARGRIAESIETALSLADGLVSIGADGLDEEWILSERNACIDCGVSFPEIEPRTFSFNNPSGACPDCTGLGVALVFDPERIVPDPTLSLRAGAIEPWHGQPEEPYFGQLQDALCTHLKIDPNTPWKELPASARKKILHGIDDEELLFRFETKSGSEQIHRSWDGVIGDLQRRVELDKDGRFGIYRSSQPCGACGGSRLRVEARSILVGGIAIHQLTALPIGKLAEFVDALVLDAERRVIADRILKEVRQRLRFLEDVGLDYISLDRPSATLSGGEGQRIRLATQIGSSLMGVLYILDEPSVGLHPRDNLRLLRSLEQLRDLGNSVLVVEHDESTINRADHVIELGPGAGLHGGALVAEGSPKEIAANPASPTGAFLSGRRRISVPQRRRAGSGQTLSLTGCRVHNLKDVTLRLPLGVMTVVTGVSGSGKSSLINDTLRPALAARLHGSQDRPGPFRRLSGIEQLEKVVDVDQGPIGRTPRSNPATYSGALDGIREIFSRVPDARVRGYAPARFSFNVKGGRCEACRGDGTLRIEMHFLPDLFVTCEQCGGRRYNRETLEILYKGRSIADVLDMSVEEALGFLENIGSIRRPLQTLHDVGLDYIHLGQPATTLSGGEAQRVKLAKELSRRSSGRTLYLLDEPTTGLHLADVERLLQVLDRLVERGNTVVVIEHHLDVIKCADHMIDLGPEAGDHGGEIVAEGTPEEVATVKRSHTGRALAEVLAR